MANISVLLPRNNMLGVTEEALNELNITPHSIKVIETSKTLAEARLAVENGAKIIVARGLQALLITKHTHIPIISIAMTTSDIAMLINKAKAMLNKEHVKLAIIWYESATTTDIKTIASILNAEIILFNLSESSNIERVVVNAISEEVDIIVGGDTVNEICKKKNIPTMFYDSTKESIKHALAIAKKMSYTAEIEDTYLSQFRALLDASHNHIYEINQNHEIKVVNRVAEDYLKTFVTYFIGKKIEEIYPDIGFTVVQKLFNRDMDTYASIIHHQQKTFSLNLTPVIYQGDCNSVIVSMSEMYAYEHSDAQTMQKLYLNGYTAKYTFSKFETGSDRFKHIIEQAKVFAISKSPLCIYGQYREENENLCESIHNHSLRRSGPYINIYCKNETLESLESLFQVSKVEEESKNLIELAHHGTLVIHDYEFLPMHLQHRIYQQMKSSFYRNSPLNPQVYADIRFIFTTQTNPHIAYQKHTLLDELYYALNTFILEIPPLNLRESDFNRFVEKQFRTMCDTYHRHLSLSPLAYKVLSMKSWKGDLNQLSLFIERIVLTAMKKTIDGEYVESLYRNLYPTVQEEDVDMSYKSVEQVQLENLMTRYNGNRQKIAAELNISTTTLWRKLKKYNLS